MHKRQCVKAASAAQAVDALASRGSETHVGDSAGVHPLVSPAAHPPRAQPLHRRRPSPPGGCPTCLTPSARKERVRGGSGRTRPQLIKDTRNHNFLSRNGLRVRTGHAERWGGAQNALCRKLVGPPPLQAAAAAGRRRHLPAPLLFAHHSPRPSPDSI